MSNSLFQMMRTASGWKLQFSGTVDVTQEEQQAILDSGLAILMVAARTGKAEVDFKENGDVSLKLNLRVSDSALMVGELKESAITYLAEGPNQGHLVFPNYGYDGAPAELPEPDELVESGFDLPLPDHPEFDVDAPDEQEGVVSEVLGHLGDYREPGMQGSPSRGDGPKVARFDPNLMPGAPSGTETLGRVYPPGHRGADKVLAEFMEEEHPHG